MKRFSLLLLNNLLIFFILSLSINGYAKSNKKQKQIKTSKHYKTKKSKKNIRGKKRPNRKLASAHRGSAIMSSSSGDKEIQVRGQSRNLQMNLILKSEKDKINFIDLRDNYNTEIGDTEF